MPAPSTSPEFATDAVYNQPGEDWDGESTKVDPGASVRAEGFQPGTLAAEHLNFQLNLLGAWADWSEDERARMAAYIGGSTGASEWVYDAARARATVQSLDQCVYYTDAVGAPLWAHPVSAGIPIAQPLFSDVYAYCNLRLPTGAILSSVDVLFLAQSGARVGSQRWEFRVWNQDWPLSLDPALSAVVNDGGGNGSRVVNVPLTSPYTVLSDEKIQVQIKGPTSPGASDYLIQLRANWTDPGPRNY